jgi:ABC-type multidrug transport system permease subunit
MNTKLLMSFSAAVMAVTGIVLTLFPQEFAGFFKLAESNIIFLQLLGGLYFGFGMLNWAAKANLIGGIYSRPVAIGNLTHFVIGGLALLKFATRNVTNRSIWIAVILYAIFAILFGIVTFTSPVIKGKSV